VDIWINYAGIAQKLKNLWEFTQEKIQKVVDTNILGTVNGSRIAIPGMLKQQSGALNNLERFGEVRVQK
jgi:NADP-dependent 3-hydroxy acid dehydrogenase YdfG